MREKASNWAVTEVERAREIHELHKYRGGKWGLRREAKGWHALIGGLRPFTLHGVQGSKMKRLKQLGPLDPQSPRDGASRSISSLGTGSITLQVWLPPVSCPGSLAKDLPDSCLSLFSPHPFSREACLVLCSSACTSKAPRQLWAEHGGSEP